MNVVKFLPRTQGVLLTGSVDSTIKIWTKNDKLPRGWTCIQTLKEHQKSINCISPVPLVNIFASGSADGTVKLWSLDEQYQATLRQTIEMTPTFIPLALALHSLTGAPKSYILAVSGTVEIIQIYVLDFNLGSDFQLTATLKGHENWVRSLEFTRETDQPFSDTLLASASQDKYIRLWRVHQGAELPPSIAGSQRAASSVLSPRSQDEESLLGTPMSTADGSPSSQATLTTHTTSSRFTENMADSPMSTSNVSWISESPTSQTPRAGKSSSQHNGQGQLDANGYLRPTNSRLHLGNDEMRNSPQSPYLNSSVSMTSRVSSIDSNATMSDQSIEEALQTPDPPALPTPSSVYGSSAVSSTASKAKNLRKPSRTSTTDSTASSKTLSNKAYRFKAQGLDFSLTFEALLFGHEDWIWSAKWCFSGAKLQLLSASADNSLAIWEPDERHGGIWVTMARLGEISAEKGSTTATGSTGGFWTGLWSPSGESVACIGVNGSWRLWHFNPHLERWAQSIGVSGHIRSAKSLAWQSQGDYLLTSSLDKTTRLHGQWKRGTAQSWHEMARPQIHGYDVNCVDSLGTTEFASGADEKSLRVFREPKAVAKLYRKLAKIDKGFLPGTPAAASVPVLGLSNKAIEAVDYTPVSSALSNSVQSTPMSGGSSEQPSSTIKSSTASTSTWDTPSVDGDATPKAAPKDMLDIEHPPLEDHLSRYTLWPETEKLYGHGFELSTLACSHDGTLIATACKASSIDHAVIILFKTDNWQMVKPPLVAHNSTVTRLRFSAGDQYLLSVGRDRQWTVFERDTEKPDIYTSAYSNAKGHTRMILDAAWAPTSQLTFATAGRDKCVKIWTQQIAGLGSIDCVTTIPTTDPATSIDFYNFAIGDNHTYFAVGEESGIFRIFSYIVNGGEDNGPVKIEIPLVMWYVVSLYVQTGRLLFTV